MLAQGTLNRVELIGRLGMDPKVRYTPTGTLVVTVRIATNRRVRLADGQTQEATDWHQIVTFGRIAEVCNQHLRKGSRVYLAGRLQTRQWEDKEGHTRYATEIVASEILFLDSGQRVAEVSAEAEEDVASDEAA